MDRSFNETNSLNGAYLNEIKVEELLQHTKVLASDEFQGRFPGTEGETKTLEYVSKEFEKIGVKPGNLNENSFFQTVPLVNVTYNPSEIIIDVEKENKNQIKLKNDIDFVSTTKRLNEEIKVEKSQLVFVGYGIIAPKYNWNDYEGIDVKGKTVLALVNDPGFRSKDPNLFEGTALTYYGRWTYKYEEAGRRGATGILLIHEEEAAAYPWSVVISGKHSQTHPDLPDNSIPKSEFEGWITHVCAEKLLETCGLNYRELVKQATLRGFKPIPLSDMYLSLTIRNTFRKFVSHNIIGYIPGSKRPDETVIFSAHYDHFGLAPNSKIYHGARDNALGVAALISLAKAALALPTPPERSFVFFSSTGEEQGLLGAYYYVANPLFPLDKTVACLNIDMLNIWGKTEDISFFGLNKSGLEQIVKEKVKLQGRTLTPEPKPEDGLFFRSDHYCFWKYNIASLFIGHGVIPNSISEISKEWTRQCYHKPEDVVTESWNLEGCVLDLQLFYEVGHQLVNSTEFPRVKPKT